MQIADANAKAEDVGVISLSGTSSLEFPLSKPAAPSWDQLRPDPQARNVENARSQPPQKPEDAHQSYSVRLQKILPIADAVDVADRKGGGQRRRSGGFPAQVRAGLLGEFVGFATVDLPVGQDAVAPGGATAARTVHHVVDVAFVRGELAACVLAGRAVALPDVPGREVRAALGTLA